MAKKFGQTLWCLFFHRKHWSMIAAEGDNAWIACARCDSQWWSHRMHVVNSNIPDGRSQHPSSAGGE